MSTLTPEDFGFTFLEEGTSVRDVIDQRINELSTSDSKDAFFVADLGDVVKKYLRWVRAMPRVTPFFAVKCNDSRPIVMTLAALGTGFDCASKSEMHLVQSLGVDPSRIIYANTCKQESHLKYAAAHGIEKMTFDNEAELVKVAKCYKTAKLVLRIAVDDSHAMHKLGKKCGTPLKKCPLLLKRAQELGLDVIGVSFHVGGTCLVPMSFTKAIANARIAFDMGEELGFKMTLLDIGGGYPGFDIPSVLLFTDFAAAINKALDKYFPDPRVKVISEPGRYFPMSAYTLATNIIGKKVDFKEQLVSDDKDNGAMEKTLGYYVNDGIHSSFRFVLFPFAHVLPSPHKKFEAEERFYSSTVYGQSCDGNDLIVEDYQLPDVQVGEWMLFYNMGAYSVTTATNFNGFPKPEIQYVMSRKMWQHVHPVSAAKEMQAPVQVAWPDDEPDSFLNVKPCLVRLYVQHVARQILGKKAGKLID